MQSSSSDDDRSKPGSSEAEDSKVAEQRVDQMLDPRRPDSEPENSEPKAEGGLPPLNIFETPQSAPDVPPDLLPEDDAKRTKAPAPKAAAKLQETEAAAEPPEPTNTDLDDAETDKAVDEITTQESDELLAAEDAQIAEAFEPKKPGGKFKRFAKSKWTWVGVIILLIIAAGLVPFTRYKLGALFLKQQYSLAVMDSKTGTPVSDAEVDLGKLSSKTDQNGIVRFDSPVGNEKLIVKKKYYQNYSSTVLVPITTQGSTRVQLIATGRQVPVKVVNKITNKPLADAEIRVLDTEAKTDQFGQATIVLPTTASTQTAEVSLNGYNTAKTKIEITGKAVPANTFMLTPAGKVYFLSNLSGNIDVVKANLDGSDRQTVLAGTGNEDPNGTVLLASRDWQYLALISKRDGGQYAKLYIINTSSGQVTTADDTPSNFEAIGWQNHDFIYDTTRSDVPAWTKGHEVLNSYDADTGKDTALDSSLSIGNANSYLYQAFYGFTITGSDLVYETQWYSGATPAAPPALSKQQDSIRVAHLDSRTKEDYKTFPANSVGYINSVEPEPGVIDFSISFYNDGSQVYYKLENDVLQPSLSLTGATFSQNYPTYLVSPSTGRTFWSELRDGKNTLLVGDENADNSKTVASLSDYSPYGWYSDQYLLVSKGGSELYIMSADGLGAPLKISDYYKSPVELNSSGYAYGD